MHDEPPQAAPAPPLERWASRLAVALLAVVPLLPSLRARFVYDDTTIIRDNPLLRGWGALLRVWGEPYWPGEGPNSLGLYRPLHVAALSTVWNLGGGAPIWFHLYALALAAVTALAVFWLLRHVIGDTTAALIAALWFATQPLHVEAVASVANTSELLVVLCTIALVWLLERFSAPDAAHQWRRAAAVGVLSACALLAKESGLLALPLAVLTVWGSRSRAATSGAAVAVNSHAMHLSTIVRDGWRIWLACAVSLGAALVARSAVLGAPVSRLSIAAQGLDGLAPWERVRVMLSLWPRIAQMLVWPSGLAPYYGPTLVPAHRDALAALSALVALGVVLLGVALARRGDRRPLVAIGWIVLTYLPASNLLAATGQLLSDRTLLGATVGIALAIAWLLHRVPRAARRVGVLLLALMIARGAFTSTNYATSWTTHRSLWTRLVATYPEEHLGYKLLGMDARARGDTMAALSALERAVAMAPTDRQGRFEYGQLLYSMGRYAESVRVLAPLARNGDAQSEPGFVALYLDAVGRAGGASAVVQAATPLARSPAAAAAASLYLGVANEQLGRIAAADSAYAQGLRANPGDSVLRARRAALERSSGRLH